MKKLLLTVAAAAMSFSFAFAGDGNSVDSPFTVAEAIAYIENGGDATVEKYIHGYIVGTPQYVEKYSDFNYYIGDTKGAETTLYVYAGYSFDGAKFTSATQLKEDDEVVIKGKLKDYNGTKEVDKSNQLVLLNGKTELEPGEEPETPDTPDEIQGYTVFDISVPFPADWTEVKDADDKVVGYTATANVGGKVFSLTYDKGTYTNNLVSPINYTASWRVYKGTTVTIASSDVNMKQIQVIFDDYEYNGTTYYAALTMDGDWTGSLEGLAYSATNEAGVSTLTFTCSEKQVRIKKIIISDGEGGGGEPGLPEGILYQNAFDSNLDGWVKVNDETIGDFAGWKINTGSVKCAIANSYYSGENHAANAKMQYTFNLEDCTDVAVSFAQAFGYYFPEAQEDCFRVYVIDNTNAVNYLTMTEYPAEPTGNWSAWATQDFDLSEYDGTVIVFGFEYNNPGGAQSMAWEIKDFVLKGSGELGSVKKIELDSDAPAVYYNLQGVRVNNPEKGLFIVVKGNKASKVIF